MYLMGIDVGGMSIKGAITSVSGEILYKTNIPTATVYDSKHSITDDIRKLIVNLLDISGKHIDEFLGIGIGHPGAIDSVNGVIKYSNNIALTNVHAVEDLQKYFNVPIYINNDANCAALGEYVYGAGKGYNDIVFITLGTGVGSGIILNGKLFEGFGCAGGEAGHMVIQQDGGPDCNCGRKGCWETFASASALIRQTKEAAGQNPNSLMNALISADGKVTGMTAFKAAKQGDPTAKKVVDDYIRYIAVGLVNIANIFRPEAILIGGGISNEKEYLTAPLQKYMDEQNFGAAFNPHVEVKVASLNNDAGILGAAALIINK